MALTYSDAGVDLDSYAEAMGHIPGLLARTHQTQPGRVMPLAGGFAGLFRLLGGGKSYEDPVLVSGSDGVGTKLKVAQKLGTFDTVGIDLVAMCVNDCLCCGAEPLFFLDYLAIPKDDPDLVRDLVAGVSEGCVRAESALLGGETAVMPDLYAPEEFDLAGFSVGVVEKSQLLDGSRIQSGDVLLMLPSAGLHSNGFSLVRKVVFEHAGLDVDSEPAELAQDGVGRTVGEELLTPTRIYAAEVRTLRESAHWSDVTGIAHITGGGLEENVTRLLTPEAVAAGRFVTVDWDAIPRPAVFDWLQKLGDVEEAEMRRVFNCGVGLVVLARPDAVKPLQAVLPELTSIGVVS